MDKKRNQTIDLLKFIFSIGIIAIHSQVFIRTSPVLYQTIIMGLLRIAVPFFFVSAGYFYYQRIVQGKETKSYLYNLLKIFLIFEAIEIVLFLIPMSSQLTMTTILPYLWKSLSIGLGQAYWFMTSLIVSLLIMTSLWKNEKIYIGMIIGFILYCVVFTIDSYGGYFQGTWIQGIARVHTSIWTWPQAGLCSSLFYLSLGAWIYKKKPVIQYSHILLVISLCMLMVEAYFLQTHGAMDGNCYLSLIIATPLLFMVCLQYPHIPFKTNRLGRMSLYIYMVHPIMLSIIRVMGLSYELLFIVATPLTIIIAYFITKPRIIV